jgi:hypothetical protein
MTKAPTIVTLALLVLCGVTHAADAPDLSAGVFVQDGSGPLGVIGYSTPTVVDWDNDGRKDLVVGQYDFGYITLYLNQGTDINPVFSGGILIESQGSPITTTYG